MLKVFTSSKCQPCRLAKKQLEDRNINFEEWDTHEPEGLAKATEMGVKGGLPYFINGDKRYAGWIGSVDALIDLLEIK